MIFLAILLALEFLQKLFDAQTSIPVISTLIKFIQGFFRRIKTHIVGPEHRFAIVVPPELARICLNETRWLDIPQPELSDAGLEFSGRLKDAYTCNLWLRTASRVLCRLAPFRAGAAEELFYKALRIPWELWLNRDIKLDIETSVEYSRISHEGRVAEVLAESIEKSLREKEASASFRYPG